jgi:hypothetical protein
MEVKQTKIRNLLHGSVLVSEEFMDSLGSGHPLRIRHPTMMGQSVMWHGTNLSAIAMEASRWLRQGALYEGPMCRL